MSGPRCAGCSSEHPALDLVGVGLDSQPARAARQATGERARVLSWGRASATHDPTEALGAAAPGAGDAAPGGALWIGVDLVKDEAPLVAAYDDARWA